jgi:hypothetical protein
MRCVLLLAVLLLGFAPAPVPRPAKKAARHPIEAAYEKIRLGMTQTELDKVMGPFKKVSTGHAQWPRWTDGQFEVDVTIWFDPITGLSDGVTEKSCRRTHQVK